MEDSKYFTDFEEKVSNSILKLTKDFNTTDGHFLEVEELDQKWKEIAPEYMADAVPQINDYPEVSIIWAAYIGMGCAVLWDKEWNKYKEGINLYEEFKRVRGFDFMDEYICEIFMGMDIKGQDFKYQENVLRSCANVAISMIRHEKVQPQTPDAFYIYSRVTHAFYKLGITIALKKLKYHYEKATINNPL